MEITDIRIKRVSTDGKMKAVVSVTFDDSFVVHDIKLIEGQDKLFTAMPSDMRTVLESAIIAKYKQELENPVEV